MLNNRNAEVKNNILVFDVLSKRPDYIMDKLKETLFGLSNKSENNKLFLVETHSYFAYINHVFTLKHGKSSYGIRKNLDNFFISHDISAILFINGSEEDKQYLIQQSIEKNCSFIEYDSEIITPDNCIDVIFYSKANKTLISDLNHKTILLFTMAHAGLEHLLNMDIIRHVADSLITVTFADKPNKLRLFSLFQSRENVNAVLKREEKNCITYNF